MTTISFDPIFNNCIIEVLKFFQEHTNVVNLNCQPDGIYISHCNDKSTTDSIHSFIPKNKFKHYKNSSQCIQGINIFNFLSLINHILNNEENSHNITFHVSDYDDIILNIIVLSENNERQMIYRICELPPKGIYQKPDPNQINYNYGVEISVAQLRKTCCNFLNLCNSLSNSTVGKVGRAKHSVRSMRSVHSDHYGHSVHSVNYGQNRQNVHSVNYGQNVHYVHLTINSNVLTLSTIITDPLLEQEVSYKVKNIYGEKQQSENTLLKGYFDLERFIAALSPYEYYDSVKISFKQNFPLYFLYDIKSLSEDCVKTEIFLESNEVEIAERTTNS